MKAVRAQRVGLRQEFFQRGGTLNAQAEFDTVRKIGIVEHHPKAERLGAQRDGGGDTAHADDPEGLH